MPAVRKPTEVLILNGAFHKNKKRTRPIGAKSDKGLGDPPTYLSTNERKVWRELIDNAPHNALTSADRIIVEVVVRLATKMRYDDQGLSTPELSMLSSSLSKLGWTPADRSKVIAIKDDDKDDDLAFLN